MSERLELNNFLCQCPRSRVTTAKKHRKVIHSQRRGGVSLVVNEGISIMDIADLDGRALVGKFYGRRVSLDSISAWAQESWALVVD